MNMEKSKVYFTDFRAKLGEGLPMKLKRLLKKAGISEIDMENKFVAIKMHFGELGNISFLRPNYAKAVADVVKEAPCRIAARWKMSRKQKKNGKMSAAEVMGRPV